MVLPAEHQGPLLTSLAERVWDAGPEGSDQRSAAWWDLFKESAGLPPKHQGSLITVLADCLWVAGPEGSKERATAWESLFAAGRGLPAEHYSPLLKDLAEQVWNAGPEGSKERAEAWWGLFAASTELPAEHQRPPLTALAERVWNAGPEGSQERAEAWRNFMFLFHPKAPKKLSAEHQGSLLTALAERVSDIGPIGTEVRIQAEVILDALRKLAAPSATSGPSEIGPVMAPAAITPTIDPALWPAGFNNALPATDEDVPREAYAQADAYLRAHLPVESLDAALQWLQLMPPEQYLASAETSVQMFQRDGFLTYPDYGDGRIQAAGS
ncbi:MAG: hypothetical protein ACRC44_03745, partial [Bifidobacterium asteroides]